MRIQALATDYDGTLAADGHVAEDVAAAIGQLRETGRRVILITGRELPELQSVCSRLDLFDVVVAENGALLYWPTTRQEEVLCESVPQSFIAEMTRLQVKPFSVGKSIFATWRPHEVVVQEVIDQLGIDYHIVFNKRAVMVLPSNVDKATGLIAAVERLNLSPLQIVGIGDAENDFSFLRICGASAAVANALPALKQECDLVMKADHGRGVIELIAGLIRGDLECLSSNASRVSRQPTQK